VCPLGSTPRAAGFGDSALELRPGQAGSCVRLCSRGHRDRRGRRGLEDGVGIEHPGRTGCRLASFERDEVSRLRASPKRTPLRSAAVPCGWGAAANSPPARADTSSLPNSTVMPYNRAMTINEATSQRMSAFARHIGAPTGSWTASACVSGALTSHAAQLRILFQVRRCPGDDRQLRGPSASPCPPQAVCSEAANAGLVARDTSRKTVGRSRWT